MRKLIPLAALCAVTISLKAQTTNTYPTSGNVGIGSLFPDAGLELRKISEQLRIGYDSTHYTSFTVASTGGLKIQSPSSQTFINTHRELAGNNIGLTIDVYHGVKIARGTGVHAESLLDIYTVDPYVTGAPLLRVRNSDHDFFGVASSGNVGIGADNPLSLLQVDDGCTKASIGDASGAGLNWGTSYLGFNATRSDTTWHINNDTHYNGGGVIYSNIYGDMYFAPIASTGTGNQTLTDSQIKNKITFRIAADGITYAKKVKVEATSWPDYVFHPKYTLKPLSEVKTYIDQNHHLPDMPSAEKVEKDGLDLGEMNKTLVKKVEELTLYLIEQNKRIEKLEEKLRSTQK
ncbi:hypothetical protein KXQ82_02020 [Mucilaginibacter sp. HMF5004]|uniref:hypothetical protein n=1 Tax=Mucilaginibacter rivuli TaxID=2857527 RepID=UPI001C5FE7D8|nr:hypothetical protein [Mucilaginibacter rivuli]MBW4888467.1 hypothetical protein [Mucilaginibacter rivuli]